MAKQPIPLHVSDTSDLVKSIVKQHRNSGKELGQTALLNYIAKAQGFQNWQSYKVGQDFSEAKIGDDKNELKQLEFTRQRLQIIEMGISSNAFDDAYLYAWSESLYPAMSDTDGSVPKQPHEHFKEEFLISYEQVMKVLNFIDDNWLDKKLFTFYELESHFGGKWGDELGRVPLMKICRYSFLCGHFDSELWDHLVKPTQHPSEARSIVRKFNRQEDIYL